MVSSVTKPEEKCFCCGATIAQGEDGKYRHQRTLAIRCDLDDDTSLLATPK
jgi:hypothetical protein